MKLYTEEQVMATWNAAFMEGMSIDSEIYEPVFFENHLNTLTPIELPSDEEIHPVKAVKEDGDWFVIPNELYEEFNEDLYNEELVDSGGFDDKWWKYKTGGDLNLIQLFAKIQGGNK